MQAILLDFFGVIAQPRYITNTIAAFLKKDMAGVRPIYQSYERGELTREAFWKKMGVKDHARIEQRLIETFKLDADFKAVHEELKKNYAIAIVSNADAFLLRSLLKRFGIADAFEAVVISEEVKSAKPDAAIYRKACAALGVNASECVFVDDRQENLETAKDLGMTTVFHLVEPEKNEYKADYAIDSLRGLLEIAEEIL
ncbi:MAG: HAD family hydrolase [Candidatus Aenigmatarchaeota archaeon]|nr:MAG: HAD family hydrolase [Candidatus Aenigmarchaeota archaeon]